MIPFLYLMLLAEQLAARILVYLHTPDGAPADHPIGFYVNVGILVLTAIGFLLSLIDRRSLRGT
jgi:hypothetical protein